MLRYAQAQVYRAPTERLVPSEEGKETMKQQHADYQLIPYPKLRRTMAVAMRIWQRKPMIHGLLEVDVTRAREFLREHKANTGEALSFTAFIIACVGKAVDEHKAVQAYRKGRKHLVLFDEVDVATTIERDMSGQKVPLIYVIRAANHKTFREIHCEIRADQVQGVAKVFAGFKAFQFLPTVLSTRFLWWMLTRYPQLHKQVGGTVMLTAVGMFGKGSGWGIPVAEPTLSITLGGISEKPAVIDGQIAIREYLCMTLSFDHSIVDGAPAARFTQRLKDLIESGYGLDDSTVASEQAVAPGTSRKSD
jgi:pyruvate/2-oxoglutarate dehydrogenase complex dihydrolipoamide acyltransferase (E2) component